VVERGSKRVVDAVLRIVAALAGTLPLAVFASVCLARFLPFAESARFTLGFMLAIPLWITSMCFVFLARSGARALGVCLGVSAALAALALGVPQ
jgi:hypothetical protein